MNNTHQSILLAVSDTEIGIAIGAVVVISLFAAILGAKLSGTNRNDGGAMGQFQRNQQNNAANQATHARR